jgi:glycosyltransferase involved in cell wall biosynthesis
VSVPTKSKILVVGPLPPPVAGTSISFQTFCAELPKYADRVEVEVINSAPRHLGQTRLFTAAHFATARRILWQFSAKIRHSDQALIFANDQFLFSLVPFCVVISTLARKRCYVRSFGGSLDQSYARRSPWKRWLFRQFMSHADGLIVQTQLLLDYFRPILGSRLHLVPGYRNVPDGHQQASRQHMPNQSHELRLTYLSHIRDEKGIFVLLESLRRLQAAGESIACDIFGPVYNEVAHRFQQELSTVPNARYLGVVHPEAVVETLQQYDALVFPSYFNGEGHPGILIEAMVAGIPVIATRFRSIPEIVQHGFNGLLVAPRDPDDLASAIRRLVHNRRLIGELGLNNFEARKEFSAADVVPRMLQSVGIDCV